MTNETHTHQDDEAAAPLGFGRVSTTAPIDAAIERHQDARGGLQRATDAVEAAGGAGVPEVAPEIEDREGDAYERLKTVRPTTPEGFRALAGAWATVLAGERMGEPGTHHADHAADSLIAGAGVCVPVMAETTAGGAAAAASDPALAAIEAHRAAYAEWDRLSDVWNRMSSDDPGYAEAMAASDLPGRREVETYEALFTTQPTTLAGAKALAEYLVVAVRRVSVNAEPSDGDRALRTVSDALSHLLGPGATDGAGRDWQAHAARHPGFVPYPAHAPVSLMALDLAIRGEAERFLRLAEEEIERRRQDYAGSPDPTVWPRVERDLRREMRMEALAMVAAKPSDDGPPDPAFAAIDASRRAEAEMAAFGDEVTGPMTPKMRAREDALCEAQRRTLAAAWATVPTTHAGRLALVDFARFQIEVHTGPDGRVGSPDDLLEEILDAFSAAIRAEQPETIVTSPGAPSEHEPSNLDALALVAAIEAEWAAQARVDDAQPAADAEAGYARRSALLSATDRLPANTCAARHAKALALAWIMYADLWRPGWSRDSYTTDGRLAFDINASLRVASTAEHPDAGLLALGPMISELVAASDRANALHAEAEERSFDMIGPAPTKPKDIQLYPTDAAYHGAMQRYARECAKHAKRRARAEKVTNLTALEEAANEADSALLRETRRLADMRATTLEGLIFKARWVERGADEELKDGIVADLLAMRGGK